MIIMSILPLLVLAGIIIGIVLLNKRLTRKPLTYQKSKWIIIGYVTVLLVAAGFSFLLPTSEAKLVKESIDEHAWENDLYYRAFTGDFSSLPAETITKSWEFPFSEETLDLEGLNYADAVLIEKNSNSNGIIEVFYVKGNHVMQVNTAAIAFTDYLPDVDVEIESNILRIISPVQKSEITLSYSDPAFTAKQFIMETGENDNQFSATSSRFVYIRIPADVKVEVSGNLYVEYVGN
jgi:hypothetical protein